MTDPPILASMLFGGGETSTVLRAMGREALVAGGTEALVQPQIQTARVQAGLPGGFVQGAENVAMVAGGAAGLTALFHGAAAGFRGLHDRVVDWTPATAAEADAGRYVERYSDLQGQNPLVPTPEAAIEHVDRVSTAQRRLLDLEPDPAQNTLTDSPVAPVRPASELDLPRAAIPNDLPNTAPATALGQRIAEAARTSEDGLDNLKRMQATANEIAPSLDDASLDLARGAPPPSPRDDPSLISFVISRGGINDADQTLAQAGITPRNRPGLISKSGMSASDMSEAAAEAGFFPPAGVGEGSRNVDQRELATAIRDELDGQKLYARHGATGNPEARANYEQTTQLHGDLRQAFDELGIDHRRLSNQDIRDQVQQIASAPSPTPERRMDWTDDAVQRAVKASDNLDYSADEAERIAIATENDLREIYRNRMDEPVYLHINGEVHAIPARDVFKALDDEDRLVREFGNCVNGVPF